MILGTGGSRVEISGQSDAAEEVLRKAGEHHPGLADLRHCRMMMEAYRWQEAAKRPGLYAYSPQASLRHVAALPAASELLGFPFLFQKTARDGAP